MPTTAELISQGYGGYQGWGDAEANADFSATGGSGKKTGGGSAGGVDLTVPSIAAYTEKAYAPADEALKAYVLALRGRQQPLDVYSQMETAAGLPGMKATATTLREQIGNLEDTIKRVEPNVAGTTRESLVTESQRQGMIEARQRPLLQDLGTLTTGLGRVSEGIAAASADLGTRMQLFLQGEEQALKPFEVELAGMNDRAARLVTGFTADTQNQLTTLMAKWNRQNELDDKETDRAFELLKMEKNYSNELAKMVETSKINIDEYTKKKSIDTKAANAPVKTGVSTKYYGTGGGSYYNSSNISNLWG